MAFEYPNHTPADPHNFTLKASAPTDIWRKPPSKDVFDAPMFYKSLPISSFQSARGTVAAKWTRLYDQGGLLLVLPPLPGGSGKWRWMKCGIEFYDNKPCMSVVVADEWADWSLSPLPVAGNSVAVEVERGEGKNSRVLYVYVVGQDGKRMPVRQITSMFFDVDEESDCWVGCFAARPTVTDGEKEELVVSFGGFEIVCKT